jgi:diaminohydroxyphosphoribosylaminopyrimidine deaminase/5-amino-6-(5-phosphoribosylamino)uracil reductase
VDEVYAFIAPRILGGKDAPSPVGGIGFDRLALSWQLAGLSVERLGEDVLLHGQLRPLG